MSILDGLMNIGPRASAAGDPPKPPAPTPAAPANWPGGLSDSELADAYGDADARYQDLADERRALKLEILKRKLEVAIGAVYLVEAKRSTSASFDRDLLRKAIGELTPYMKVSESTSLTARRIKRAG